MHRLRAALILGAIALTALAGTTSAEELECGLPEGCGPIQTDTPVPTGEIGDALVATPRVTLPPTDTAP
jgi:hypothetical protein